MKFVAGVLIAGGLSAQSVQTLAQIDDVVTGVGAIASVDNAVISDNGTWLMLCGTDGAPNLDSVVLKNGLLLLREGDAVSSPEGATIHEFVDWEIDRRGSLVQHVRISVGGEVLDALYWNDRLLVLQNTPVGTVDSGAKCWNRFEGFRVNSESQVLILANIIDASDIGLPVEGQNTLVLIETDPNGDVIEKKTLVVEGYELPGLPSPVDRFPANPGSNTIGLNRYAEFLWSPITEDGTQFLMITTEEIVSHTDFGFVDPDDSRIDGRRIRDFEDYRGDINNMRDFAYSCRLRTFNAAELESDWVVALNNEKFVQEGDVLPSLADAVIDEGTDAPIYLANNQIIYWQAALRDTGAHENLAFMRGDSVIVRKGHTVLDGKLVTDIEAGPEAFYVSSDGRYWSGRVQLEGTGDALAYADFGLAVPLPGRRLNEGVLRVVSGNVLLDREITLLFDDAQAPGTPAFLFFSTIPAVTGAETGHIFEYGELLVGLPLHFLIPGPTWYGSAVEVNESAPSDPALVGTVWFGQAAYLNFTHQTSETVRLTNGLRIELGQP